MTHAFHSDAAEKILAELTQREQAAVETIRRSLEAAAPAPWPSSRQR
ncbi:hypothetical protein ACFW96_30680 [Streptomyces gardneri]